MIEAWTVHCPHCSTEVEIRGTPRQVTCDACGEAFRPAGMHTAALPAAARSRAGRPPVPDADSQVGQRFGRWSLTRLIGGGGMGRVYEARDRLRRKRVALKLLRDDLAKDPGFVRRFHREAKVLSSLSHPHIVSVVDRGLEPDGRLWFAMEYVRGESLRQRIRRGALKHGEALRIAAQVASALAYAHEHGVVHRDLKPENVLIDDGDVVRLVDFGLSKLHGDALLHDASTRLTRTDVIMGTYEYMAPEQRRGERDVDGRADIYSVGVILYEMLTGALPLGRFALPSEADHDIPRAVDTVITKALSPSVGGRFATAAEFQEALERAGDDAMVASPHEGAGDTLSTAGPSADDRGVLRHVEIISALDQVGGVLALLVAMGGLSITAFLVPGPVFPLTGLGAIVAFVAGIWLLRQGGRLRRFDAGAREAQVTASVFMLLFPPFVTALGIYGLVVMTSDKARRAFATRRKRIGGRPPLPTGADTASVAPSAITKVTATYAGFPTPARAKPPSWLLRCWVLGAILWALHAGLSAWHLFSAVRPDDLAIDQGRSFLFLSTAASIVSAVVLVHHLAIRKIRQGFGLALFCLVLFVASTSVLAAAVRDAKTSRDLGALDRPVVHRVLHRIWR